MLCSVRPRFDVYMVFSAAEEFGGYGAHTAAFEIAPDEALILDTTFAVSPYTDKSKGKELGGGCAVGISPMLDTHMTEAVIGVARSHAIPYQTEVMSGKPEPTRIASLRRVTACPAHFCRYRCGICTRRER